MTPVPAPLEHLVEATVVLAAAAVAVQRVLAEGLAAAVGGLDLRMAMAVRTE